MPKYNYLWNSEEETLLKFQYPIFGSNIPILKQKFSRQQISSKAHHLGIKSPRGSGSSIRLDYYKEFTEREKQIIDGLLISDAYLRKCRTKNESSNFSITQSLSHKGLIDFVEENIRLQFSRYSRYKREMNTDITLRSKGYDFLTKERIRWYKNDKKIIPTDITLSPLFMLMWYLGDGCIKENRRIILATHNFTKHDVESIINKIKDELNINFRLLKDRKPNKIYYYMEISNKKELIKFFNYLEIMDREELTERYPLLNDFKYKFFDRDRYHYCLSKLKEVDMRKLEEEHKKKYRGKMNR